MNLFEEIQSNDNIETLDLEFNENSKPPKIVIEKLIVKKPCEQHLSPLAQYFLAPFVLIESNGVLDIPIMDRIIHDQVMEEIAPHFNGISKITADGQVMLSMQNVIESSTTQFINLLNNELLNPIVADVYGTSTAEWGGDFTIKEYKVNLDAVQKLVEYDVHSLWTFFKASFISASGYFVVMPSEWEFDESFRERTAVQAFASVCNSMTITVNTETNTISSVLMD
ncbi:hypothetical protein PGH26_08970 [Sporosarcina jeotgali]|uniref:Uncharacterized protein n=1 Tax=Sporosarcina jeotgali TaxID=3020056 RepID=A0ABZ0KUC3_9BACL|nr:hypothetical protein [Sporosarcina sp. B2O-1]WOV83068.1 hypothetical protein PGH26_08970 [Sporosarcina sp. B2O-1]